MTIGVEAIDEHVKYMTSNLPGERVTLQHIRSLIVDHEFYRPNHTPHMTICTIKLKNGFVVIGDSTPDDPRRFDSQLGYDLAMNAAIAKIWTLEGYLLRDRLSQDELWRKVNNEPETAT